MKRVSLYILSLLLIYLDSTIHLVCSEAVDEGLTSSREILEHFLFTEPNLYLEKLGQISSSGTRLERTFLDEGHNRAASALIEWMAGAGMRPWRDAVGNVRGRAPAESHDAPAMLLGSHYDTVVDAGKYDGALGIISGIVAVKAMMVEEALKKQVISVAEMEAQVSRSRRAADPLDLRRSLGDKLKLVMLSRPIEVVGFSDEEGVRFQTTFLGSKALSGSLLDSGALEKRDSSGVSVLEALMQSGLTSSKEDIESSKIPKELVAGYVEVHMEQGPVLEHKEQPLGVVSNIAGQSFLFVSLEGEQGHAGAVPMHLRKDPMAAAAEIMMAVESFCLEVSDSSVQISHLQRAIAHSRETLIRLLTWSPKVNNVHSHDWRGFDSTLVCTVGKLDLWPGASNVIPRQVNLTLDIRSQDDSVRSVVVDQANKAVRNACEKRGVSCKVELKHEAAAVHCDESISQLLSRAVLNRDNIFAKQDEEYGFHSPPLVSEDVFGTVRSNGSVYNNTERQIIDTSKSHDTFDRHVIFLSSGAGHDAIAMAESYPVGMLFVRCKGGVSHSPLELVSPQDVASAAKALFTFLNMWSQELIDSAACTIAPMANVTGKNEEPSNVTGLGATQSRIHETSLSSRTDL